MRIIFFIVSLTFFSNIYSQNWELKRDTEEMKIYTSDIKNSSIRKYKIIALSNTPISKVHSLLTDYDNYTKMFNEIVDFKLLSKNLKFRTSTSLVKYNFHSSKSMLNYLI